MITNVLVPLDGSPLAEAALPYAKVIVRRTGASLMLVRAARNRSPLGDVTYQQQHSTLANADDYLALVADDLAVQGYHVNTGVPYGGSAAEWIVEETELRHADFIVMATHDRIGPDRWLHGSVAEVVVNRASVPVMLVRGQSADELAQRLQSTAPVIIVPLDGSEVAEAVLPEARSLALTFAARVILVGVVPNVRAEARSYLDDCAGRVGTTNVQTVLREGDPAAEIAAVAHYHAAAAVVMATHGRTGIARSILGSVAGGVLHQSACPVVLIRPRELRAAEEPAVQSVAASA
jgi:nucleotide-binding universal stress UspA family protein